MKTILFIPHIKVHNANAFSSPYTIGFPALTAWFGMVHAMQRNLSIDFPKVVFNSFGVATHNVDLQIYSDRGSFFGLVIGTSNPLDEKGDRPSFIQEPRCHLDASVIIDCSGIDMDHKSELLDAARVQLASKLKLAGGDVLSFGLPELLKVDDDDDKDVRRFFRRLMPSYILVERRNLIRESVEKEGIDTIDALLSYLTIHHSCEKDSNGDVSWTSKRKASGWLVPIAVGFHGLTDLDSDTSPAINKRDKCTPHLFVESIVTLGEFKMPHRLENFEELLWYSSYQQDKRIYRCFQKTNKL